MLLPVCCFAAELSVPSYLYRPDHVSLPIEVGVLQHLGPCEFRESIRVAEAFPADTAGDTYAIHWRLDADANLLAS